MSEYRITPEAWAKAYTIGFERYRSHRGRRKDHEDRGGENKRVDVMGSFGEIRLCEWCLRKGEKEAGEDLREGFYMEKSKLGRNLDRPDATLSDGTGIDAKTFDWKPKKKYFAVNKRKHDKLEGSCQLYFCALAKPRGKLSLEMTIPYDDVSKWDVKKLGGYGSPWYGYPIFDLLDEHGESQDEERFRTTYSKSTLKSAIKSNDFREWTQTLPSSKLGERIQKLIEDL